MQTPSPHTFFCCQKSLIAMPNLCYITINMSMALGFNFQISYMKDKQYNSIDCACTDLWLIFSVHEQSLHCVLHLSLGRQ